MRTGRSLTSLRSPDAILDTAACLFARQGLTGTSLQAVADALGCSKAGLLHHFPTKPALYEAAVAGIEAQERALLRSTGDLPPGPGRDRLVVEGLVDCAVARPGLTALSMTLPSTPPDPVSTGPGAGLPRLARTFFRVDQVATDPERLVRVVSALGALTVAPGVADLVGGRQVWRGPLVAAVLDALGHPVAR